MQSIFLAMQKSGRAEKAPRLKRVFYWNFANSYLRIEKIKTSFSIGLYGIPACST
jgi:hypothetical protein